MVKRVAFKTGLSFGDVFDIVFLKIHSFHLQL
jgi:hypothetical protein